MRPEFAAIIGCVAIGVIFAVLVPQQPQSMILSASFGVLWVCACFLWGRS